MTATQVFPLMAGGAAEDCARLLGERAGLRVTDRSPWPRFGLKGVGAAAWVSAAGVEPPSLNGLAQAPALAALRLGTNDIAFLGEAGDPGAVATLRARWQAAPGPKGYSSWREEAWAWLHLDGPALEATLARHCAIDLRPGRFAADRVAQTRFAHVDAVVIRRDGGAEVLFDIAASASVLTTLRQGGDPS